MNVLRNNWAVLFHHQEVIWKYGDTLNDEQLGYLSGAIQALRTFGQHWTGADITSIGIRDPNNPQVGTTAILIIRAGEAYTFVISDPTVTARLLAKEELTVDLDAILRGVLVANALLLYSKFRSTELLARHHDFIEQLFRQAIASTGVSPDQMVKEDQLDLSLLNLAQLIIFHNNLRLFLEKSHFLLLFGESWFILADKRGVPIPLYLGLDRHEAVTLTAFLCTLYHFCQTIFSQAPIFFVFGIENLTYLYFGTTQSDYLFFIRQPHHLFANPEFYMALEKELDWHMRQILDPPLRRFLAEILAQQILQDVSESDESLREIYDRFQRQLTRIHTRMSEVLEVQPITLDHLLLNGILKTPLMEYIQSTYRVYGEGRQQLEFHLLVVGEGKDHLDHLFGIISEQIHPQLPSHADGVITKGLEIQLELENLYLPAKVHLWYTPLHYNDVAFPSACLGKEGLLVIFDCEDATTLLQVPNWVESSWNFSDRPVLPTLLLGINPDALDMTSTVSESSLSMALTKHQLTTLVQHLKSGLLYPDLIHYRFLEPRNPHSLIEAIEVSVVQILLHKASLMPRVAEIQPVLSL